MPLTTIVLRCARCQEVAEYRETKADRAVKAGISCRSRIQIDRTIRRDGWMRRMNGKRLEWVCGECYQKRMP